MDVIDRATYKVLSNQKLLYRICEEDACNENKIFCKLFLIDGAENFVLKVLWLENLFSFENPQNINNLEHTWLVVKEIPCMSGL